MTGGFYAVLHRLIPSDACPGHPVLPWEGGRGGGDLAVLAHARTGRVEDDPTAATQEDDPTAAT